MQSFSHTENESSSTDAKQHCSCCRLQFLLTSMAYNLTTAPARPNLGHMNRKTPFQFISRVLQSLWLPTIWLRHHPLRGVDSVRLQILKHKHRCAVPMTVSNQNCLWHPQTSALSHETVTHIQVLLYGKVPNHSMHLVLSLSTTWWGKERRSFYVITPMQYKPDARTQGTDIVISKW